MTTSRPVVTLSRGFCFGVALALTAAAGAQTPGPLTNPSFENTNLFNSVEPEGWHNISNPFGARHRANNDGLLPAVTARTGNRCIELRAQRNQNNANNGGFIGFTTDTVNFFDPNFSFYDPFFDIADTRDVRVSGYYMIPADQPIVGDAACIKLDIKLFNQNVATREHFAPDGTDPLAIQGHTNGEWRYYEITWSYADILAQYQGNIAPNGCQCVPASPPPNHIKITPSRFGPDGTDTSGTIFWDDLNYERVTAGPALCPADFDGNGIVNPDDLSDFITAYFTVPPEPSTDFDGNGIINPDDLSDFITAYFTPCP
jgi:hypothetical protein